MGKFDGFLILTDMDGTLTVGEHLSDENAEAIRYFQDNGGYFSVATGRQPWYIKTFEPKMFLNAPVVALNGAAIYDLSQECLLSQTLLPTSSMEVVEYVMTHYPKITDVYANTLTDTLVWQRADMNSHSLSFQGKDVMKLLFYSSDTEAILSAAADLSLRFPQFDFFRSWENGLEMLNQGAGKGECIPYFKSHLPIHTVIGVGDYENDISLITIADIGYAVSNATPSLLAKADKIAPLPNDHAIASIISDIEKGLTKN